jgi:hypothetical protein
MSIHGVLLLDFSSGSVLFYKAYTPNLGLRNPHGDSQENPQPKKQTKDEIFDEAMALSSFFSALVTNVGELLDGSQGEVEETEMAMQPLKQLKTGKVSLHFSKDSETRVLTVVSTSPAVGATEGEWLAKEILVDFCSKFREKLSDPRCQSRFLLNVCV